MYPQTRNLEKSITISQLSDMKRTSRKITCLTAYDASFALLLDGVGIDIILVGDSLGSVVQGHRTTVPVTMDDMVYHTLCVSRGCSRSFVIADMPFGSYTNSDQAITSAARLIQEANAMMVKLEGGRGRAQIIQRLKSEGIPVCGHLGVLPQSILQLGGYHVQGKDDKTAKIILEDALILEKSGASLLVLECIPANLARDITRKLTIPTIGIGAGADCDGQVLVIYDMLGISFGKRPKFVKDFMQDAGGIEEAVKAYVAAVRDGRFPTDEHSF